MRSAIAPLAALALALSTPALAFQTPAPAEEPQKVTVVPAAPERPSPTRNVKVDVTITDQTGSGSPMKKVVSIVMAEGRPSGVRNLTSVPLATGGSNRNLPLNVDALAIITPEQRVLLELKFNYSTVSFITPVGTRERPAPTTPAERDLASPRPSESTITEELRVLVVPGTPMVVARSADPVADRTVTVEVRCDIVK